MIRAYKQVMANGKNPRVDGVDVKNIKYYSADHHDS